MSAYDLNEMEAALIEAMRSSETSKPEPKRDSIFEGHAAEQWGRFLHSYLVLMGVLTPEQVRDPENVVVDSLVVGLDVAAQHYEALGYRDFKHMNDCAEYGKFHMEAAAHQQAH